MPQIFAYSILLWLITLLNVSAQTPVSFQKVSCLEKNGLLCSDSSVLKVYVRRFERECIKRSGQFQRDQLCNKSLYLKSYCSIADRHFQIFYSPKHFSQSRAKKHCLQQTIGPYALQWHK